MTNAPDNRGSIVFVFSIATLMMALKPLLLHLTRSSAGAAISPECFQLAAEMLKLLICSVALVVRRMLGLQATLWPGAKHSVLFSMPATVYLLMNVMTVRAARLLTPAIFQLVANLKILCTAFASWAILSRQVSSAQWLALVLLTVGVTIGQWQGKGAGDTGQSSSFGVLLMVINSCLSALGGVATEKLLKGSATGQLSIFATNVHMASYTLLLNGFVVLSMQGLPELQTPTPTVLLALINEAMNGILISLLIRQLDGIAKNFAFCISVFVTAGLSAYFLGHHLAAEFYMGSLITSVAVVMYTRLAASSPSPTKTK